MPWLLISLLGLALIALAAALLKLAASEKDHAGIERADHAKCIAHIASVTSNRFVSARLLDIADEWDSIEGQSELRRVINTKYRTNGPSAVAIRLREIADELTGELVIDDDSA